MGTFFASSQPRSAIRSAHGRQARMWSRGISNAKHLWVCSSFPTGRNRSLTHEKDLLQHQRRTWEKIPGNLREKMLQQVRDALQDQITQNHGPEEEITIGYEDDHEALQAELNALEAGRNWNGRTTHESWTTKVATGKVRVFSRSPAKGVRGDSRLGEEDISESQEHWYMAEEGKTDEESELGNAESLTADAEEGDGSCVVGGNLAEKSSKE